VGDVVVELEEGGIVPALEGSTDPIEAPIDLVVLPAEKGGRVELCAGIVVSAIVPDRADAPLVPPNELPVFFLGDQVFHFDFYVGGVDPGAVVFL